ncbi:hypothetical protein EST38_g9583 [Candolleomyces aberdarensis]|uniref:NACHT domain-containing protein n=1 Tax=Candolleomyces aberdarensis TaxID=2316362 RepID=A0A4Q2DA86_9AGAR|nr:hypothetical protein EST38_g9583 [Candolleomyces aberdarensis]
MDWAQGEQVPSKLLCLTGSAGSGKSALAQTISETCAQKGRLGASFFFSVTDVQRNTPDRFVASLAYQLSRSMRGVNNHILRAVGDEPAIFKMSLETQAEVLLINPVLNAAQGSKSKRHWIIVVDGLDECRGEHHQAQVLRVLHTCVDRGLPFRIFITSRPEYAMRSALALTGHLNGAYHIILNEHDATADIRLYLRRRLREIGQAKGDDHWPSEDVLEIIVEGASGQFIFATTVVKFVGDRRSSPFRRLQIIVDWASNSRNKHTRNPFALLDALYTNILFTAQAAYQESFEGEGECPRLIHRLLSFMVITDLCTIEDKAFTGARAIESVLQWDDSECDRLVEDLYSVAQVKPSVTRGEFVISFYHKSFLDYLLDSSRSQSFHMPPDVLFADLAMKVLNHINAVDLDYIPAGWGRRCVGAADDRWHWSKVLDVALLAWPHLLPLALEVDPNEPVYN